MKYATMNFYCKKVIYSICDITLIINYENMTVHIVYNKINSYISRETI